MLITYLGGQERLHCTDERLDIAYDNPSLFCQISGMEKLMLASYLQLQPSYIVAFVFC